jgi:hypothetical protein
MIAVGVDTHKHEHVAVALNQLGQLLGEIAVAASAAGYRMRLLEGGQPFRGTWGLSDRRCARIP